MVAQGRAGMNSRAKVRKSLRDSSHMSRGEIRHSAPTLRSLLPHPTPLLVPRWPGHAKRAQEAVPGHSLDGPLARRCGEGYNIGGREKSSDNARESEIG